MRNQLCLERVCLDGRGFASGAAITVKGRRVVSGSGRLAICDRYSFFRDAARAFAGVSKSSVYPTIGGTGPGDSDRVRGAGHTGDHFTIGVSNLAVPKGKPIRTTLAQMAYLIVGHHDLACRHDLRNSRT